MRKKILVAEQSDAIRNIAETLLHQNGYDVVSASDGVKAKELIITSEPNMLIIGADIQDASGQYLYDTLEDNPNLASIPLLLIDDPSKRQLPYPEEVVLPRPFDPRDFIERVKLFIGGGLDSTEEEEEVKTADAFSSDSVNDEFLDAALGIDRIEVEDSSVMDETQTAIRLKPGKEKKKRDAYDLHDDNSDESNDKTDENGQKVESLMIRDEAAPPKQDSGTTSTKIEISNDQYGLSEDEKPASEQEQQPQKGDHDYDWFIKEMQKESVTPKEKLAEPQKDEKLKKTDTSDAIEPVNPPKEKTEPEQDSEEKPKRQNFQPGTGAAMEPEIKPGGVDQFISDFKKEIEQLNLPEDEKFTAPEQPQTEPGEMPEADQSAWVESHLKSNQPSPEESPIDPAEIHHIVNHLVEMLAEKLAKKIIDKIDKDEIYRILKDELAGLMTAPKK